MFRFECYNICKLQHILVDSTDYLHILHVFRQYLVAISAFVHRLFIRRHQEEGMASLQGGCGGAGSLLQASHLLGHNFRMEG